MQQFFLSVIGAAMTALLVSLYMLISVTTVPAHDAAHPELNAWFDNLASGKGVCCSFTDGVVIEDADWESHDGHYRVHLQRKNEEGEPFEWVDVPDEAVITEPNRDGRTMVWPIYGYLGIAIRCFMPGSMS